MSRIPDTPTRKQVLQFIAKSASYGNLGLFVGAGFSKAVLNETPDDHIALSWGELLERAAEKMQVKYKSIDKAGVSYPDIASTICDRYSKKKDVSFSKALRRLKKEISALTSWYPTPAQRERYSRYLEPFDAAWIITTNYDLVIESLLTGKSIPLGPNDPLSAPQGIVPVFHLHGVRTNPEEIIITQEDYVSLFRPTEYRQIKLSLTIKESTTLVLGYSLSDVNVLTALDWSENVFKGRHETYPRDVIQVIRTENPQEEPYRDRNGILILESAELSQFFKEFKKIRDVLTEKEAKQATELKRLAGKLDTPAKSMIGKFIDEKNYRKTMLEVLAKFPLHLIAGFVSFLNRCIDETWERSVHAGAFEAYNQNLTIILDILTAFPLESFPPALFQTAAYGLERVAYYVGNTLGQSYAAKETWDRRCGKLQPEVIKELLSVAEQYRYTRLKKLVKSIPK